MTTNNQNIEEKIEQNTPALSADEKRALWSKIDITIAPKAIPSPFLFSFVKTRAMVAATFALVFLLGTAGTVAASGKARPGDLLFPIDQAVENIQLTFASDDVKRAELKREFAEERVEELRSLLAEDQGREVAVAAITTISAETPFEAEADVFTDTTIVKVEVDGHKTVFETAANNREAVIDEIVSRFAVDRARVESVLDFEIENRASRVSERVGEDSDARVNTSLQLLDTLMADLSDTDRSRILSEVVNEFTTGGRVRTEGDDVRIRVRNEGDDSRIEIRNEDGERIRIREKEGEVKIEVKEDNRSSDDGVEIEDNEDDSDEHVSSDDSKDEMEDLDDDSFDDDYYDEEDEDEWKDDEEDEDDERGNDDSNGRVRVEVRVEDGVAEVRVDYGRNSEEFKTAYVSKTALIATIALRTGLSESAVASALDLEVKD